jgi:hypothetical protein
MGLRGARKKYGGRGCGCGELKRDEKTKDEENRQHGGRRCGERGARQCGSETRGERESDLFHFGFM